MSALYALLPVVGPWLVLELWTQWRRRHER